MWYYDTNIGRIFIKPINGKYFFVFKGMAYTGHSSPHVVADDIYFFVTGCDEWDTYGLEVDSPNVPRDLSEWIRVK